MKNRSYSLDLLRIVATFLVVFHHYQQLTGASFLHFNFYNEEKQVFTVLIELFFVLSGYLLASSVVKIGNTISFKDFFLKKAIRLLPIGAVSVIVYECLMFLIITFLPEFPSYFAKEVNVWGAVVTAFGMQAGWVFDNPFINNPLWYVSVLIWCYILMYFVTYVANKMKVSPIYFYMGIIFLGFAIITYDFKLPFLNSYMARGYVSFFPGLLFGMFRKNHKITAKGVIASIILILGFVYMTISHFGYIARGYNYIFIFFIATSFITVFDSEFLRKICNLKIIAFFSNISYGLIVWHVPVFLIIFIVKYVLNLAIDYSNPLVMLSFTGIVLVWCILAYYAIEKNINNYLSKKMINKKDY